MDGRPAATGVGAVDDVVVDKGAGLDQFDRRTRPQRLGRIVAVTGPQPVPLGDTAPPARVH